MVRAGIHKGANMHVNTQTHLPLGAACCRSASRTSQGSAAATAPTAPHQAWALWECARVAVVVMGSEIQIARRHEKLKGMVRVSLILRYCVVLDGCTARGGAWSRCRLWQTPVCEKHRVIGRL